MKTIRQVADELGVSKQAVWQRIKRNIDIRQAFEQHSQTINGTVYVDEDGENVIRCAYSDDLKTVNVDETAVNIDETSDNKTVNADNGALIDVLQKTIDTLQQQLTAKDKQIDELTAMLKGSQTSVESLTAALTAAQALHAGTMQTALTERSGASDSSPEGEIETKQKRKGFFKRMFGRKD